MRTFYIGQALTKLGDGAEWTYYDNNLETLIWHSEPKKKPSIEEIEKLADELEIQEKEIINAQQNAKLSAVNKLIDLGLTEEEAKAFLG